MKTFKILKYDYKTGKYTVDIIDGRTKRLAEIEFTKRHNCTIGDIYESIDIFAKK